MNPHSNSGIYNRAYTNGCGNDDSSSHAIISSDINNGRQGHHPYQIEFLVQNQGKHFSSTKRIIHFRFGYANVSSMLKGKTGSDCRGEEHNIVVTWSTITGKKSIMMDDREIHYVVGKHGATKARLADMLEAVWQLSNHVYELKCYAYKPATGSPEKRNPRWKQYSLVIDGTSFFELPQIFDLGLKGLMTVISAPPSLIHSTDSSSVSVLNSTMRSYQSNSGEIKDLIQARIMEQRKLLDARKNSPSAETSKARSSLDRKSHTVSANTHDTGVHNSGLESGVYSAAPSELDEVKNRMQAPPPHQAPATSASTATMHINRSSNNAISQRQFLYQRQIQQSQHNSHSEERPWQRDQLVHPPPPTRLNNRPPTDEDGIRDSFGEYDRAYNRKSMAAPPDMTGVVCNRMSTIDLSLCSDADTLRDDSTYVLAASFVPQKLTLTKPSAPATTTNLPQGVPPSQGVNRWGYY